MTSLQVGDLPISGTASEVGGMVSATSSRNTVRDSRIVTPETEDIPSFNANCCRLILLTFYYIFSPQVINFYVHLDEFMLMQQEYRFYCSSG